MNAGSFRSVGGASRDVPRQRVRATADRATKPLRIPSRPPRRG